MSHQIKNIFAISLFTIFLSGCATFQASYPSKMKETKADLEANKPILAQKKLDEEFSDENKEQALFKLESGLMFQLNDQPKKSIEAYATVIHTLKANQLKAKIQASKIFENTAAILTNDREMPFDTPDYAMTFLYAYQALNYLSENDLSNSLVSIRQLSNAQSWIKQQQDITEAGKEKLQKDYPENDIEQDKLSFDKSKEIQSMYAQAKNISNSYENGFSYYLASILYMAYGNYNDAMVSIKDSHRLLPDNHYVTQTYKEIEQGLKGWSSLPQNEGRLVVLYAPDFVAARKSFKLPLFLGKLGFQMIQIPYYSNDDSKIKPFNISILDTVTKKSILSQEKGELLVNTTQMALKSLTKAYPAIITREVVRFAAKSAISYASQESAGIWGLLASSAYSFATSATDQRSWLLLPNNIQLFESPLPVGDYQAKINNISHDLKINNQKTTLLWIVQQGNFKKVFYFQL